MADRYVTIKGRKLGLNVSNVSIYKDSISAANLISKVPKNVFMSGYTFLDVDTQEDYLCQADDPCRTVLNLSIRSANQPPTVTITGATSSLTNANVTLTANANDPEGFPMTYLWSTGETTQTITVTSATAQTATYTVTVTDDIGDTGSDTHDIVWTVPTTTTTAAPGTTTTTTAAPCTDCAGDINSISDFSAAVGGTTGTISITGTNISPSSVYTWDPNLVTVSLSGSTLTWTTNNTDTCGTAHVRVFANNTAGGNCCNEAEEFYITVTGCVGPTTTTTTTTTAAPVTTTPPTTTTTTTNAPPQTCYAHQVQYDSSSTCQGNISVYYTDNNNWCSSTKLFVSSSACAADNPSGYAPAGYYTYEVSVGTYEYSYWNGSSFSQMCVPC